MLPPTTPKPPPPAKTMPPVERYNRYNQPSYNRYDQERLSKDGKASKLKHKKSLVYSVTTSY